MWFPIHQSNNIPCLHGRPHTGNYHKYQSSWTRAELHIGLTLLAAKNLLQHEIFLTILKKVMLVKFFRYWSFLTLYKVKFCWFSYDYAFWDHNQNLSGAHILNIVLRKKYLVALNWKCVHQLQRASYQTSKIAGCACTGNAGNVFPATTGERSRHAYRH